MARFGNPSLNVPGVGQSEVSIYPNPVKKPVVIHAPGQSIYRVQFLSMTGQVLEDFSMSVVDRTTLTPRGLHHGVGLIKVYTNAGVITRPVLFAD